MKENHKIYLLCLFFVGLIFSLHFIFPSMLNGMTALGDGPRISHDLSDSYWRLHKTNPSFAGRYLVSGLASVFNDLGVSFAWSFIIINFTALFFVGILIYKIAEHFKLNFKQKKLSLVLFYLGFSIFFAFFRSIDTYDDPLQYIFLLGCVLAFLKNKNLLGSTLFLASLVARESGLILIPGLYLIIQHRSRIYKILSLAIPTLIYSAINYYILSQLNLWNKNAEYTKNSRLTHLFYNFQDIHFSIETIVYAFLVLSIPFFIIYLARQKKIIEASHKNFIIAAVISFLINTIVVVTTTRAREARLYALPLIFLWPLLGYYFDKLKMKISFSITDFSKFQTYAIFIIATLSSFVYRPTYSGGFDYGYRFYLFIFIILFYQITKSQLQKKP